MLLSHYDHIHDLINHRIEIEHKNQYKVVDVLGYNVDTRTVYIEYMFKEGEHHAQKVSYRKIWNWIKKASRLQHRVLK